MPGSCSSCCSPGCSGARGAEAGAARVCGGEEGACRAEPCQRSLLQALQHGCRGACVLLLLLRMLTLPWPVPSSERHRCCLLAGLSNGAYALNEWCGGGRGRLPEMVCVWTARERERERERERARQEAKTGRRERGGSGRTRAGTESARHCTFFKLERPDRAVGAEAHGHVAGVAPHRQVFRQKSRHVRQLGTRRQEGLLEHFVHSFGRALDGAVPASNLPRGVGMARPRCRGKR